MQEFIPIQKVGDDKRRGKEKRVGKKGMVHNKLLCLKCQ
jgi:hypothetical protein